MEICRQAFEKDLMAAIDKDAEAKKVQVKVETRNTSIIVKTENGQEYIALDKNADISKVDDAHWYGFDRADSNGNIEIEELASDITYVVYTRIHGLSPKAAKNAISLSEAEGGFVVFKNCNTSLEGTVSYDEQSNELKLNIPFIVKNVAIFYGDEDCEGEIRVVNADGLTLNLESFSEDEIQFVFGKKPSAKEYNIKFQYVVIVGEREA